MQPFPAADQYRAVALADQGVALVWTGQVDAGRAVLTAALDAAAAADLDYTALGCLGALGMAAVISAGSTKPTRGRRGVWSWPGRLGLDRVNQRRHLLPDRGPGAAAAGPPPGPGRAEIPAGTGPAHRPAAHRPAAPAEPLTDRGK